MASFTLDYEEIEDVTSYPVLVTKFESQAEQRRLITNKKRMGFKIKTSNLTVEKMKDYVDFYDARKGSLETFDFYHLDDDETYTVRFNSDLKRKKEGGVYRLEFEFIIVNN